MLTKKFWLGALERAVKSAAQFTLYTWGLAKGVAEPALDAVGLPNAFAFDWKAAGGAALAGAIFSLLTSIVSAPWGDKGSPSLVEQ